MSANAGNAFMRRGRSAELTSRREWWKSGKWKDTRREAPYAQNGRRGGGEQGGDIEINELEQQRIVRGTAKDNRPPR